MSMKSILIEWLTWWNGQTVGTRLHTWRKGERVGTDEFGNIYYRTRGGAIDPALGIERRWVIYNGEADASKIPPGWHGWMHHRTDAPPSREDYKPRDWQLGHRPNMTGTPQAYRPRGSTLRADPQPGKPSDYAPWTPGS
jgi:NADH:ubiquinone oxidoreductase subunit